MILYIGIAFTVFFIFFGLISNSYKYPLIFFIIVSPVVAASWNYQFSGFSLIHIFYSFLLLIFLLRILLKKDNVSNFPYMKLLTLYFILLIGISVYISTNMGILKSLDFFIKSLFMPIAFGLFSIYFTDSKSGKFLVYALILSGVFPLFFILVQKITGSVGIFRQSKGLTRYVGLYHDAATVDVFLVQSLIGIMLFWHYFLKRRQTILRFIFVILFCLLIVGIYSLYTKTLVLTFALWLLTALFLKPNRFVIVSLLIILILLTSFLGQRILTEINQIFSREVELVEGNLEMEYALSGRGRIWINYFNVWLQSHILNQIFGNGLIFGHLHNDFLRMLLSGGLLFLVFSIFLFSTLVSAVIKDFQKKKYFIHFITILCIIYYFIVALGRTPGLYPNIQMLTWGFVGLSLNIKADWTK